MDGVSEARLVVSFFDDIDAGWRGVRLAMEAGVRMDDVGLLDNDGIEARTLWYPRSPESSGRQGVGPLAHLIATAITGGVLPCRTGFLDPGTELTVDDVRRIGIELESGRVAVLVLVPTTASPLSSELPALRRVVPGLAELGGRVETHHLTLLALRMAAGETRTHPP